MADLLAVPLKKPSDVGVIKPLTNIIATSYSTAEKPENFENEIAEFSKLRATALNRAYEKHESSLEVLYRYYDQIKALEAKIPPSEVQIPFKWKDAFNKGSLFGGKVSLTLSSLSYERVCVLFNIAALQSSLAASQSTESDDGLKLAAKLLQSAAGIFDYLKTHVIGAIQFEPTPDLNPETLSALSALMLAQAQEIFVIKAVHDKMKEGIIAKLASQCEEYYAEALKLFQKESLRNILDRELIPLIAGKQAGYHGLAEYYQSMVCKEKKEIGEEIGRLQKSLELMKHAQTRSGKSSLFSDCVIRIEKALVEANKDNNFIYHDRIPEMKLISGVPRAALAKPTPMPQHFSTNFKDLFDRLVPVQVSQVLATYEVRRSDLVNREITELRKSTQLLNDVLASQNLPASLEDSAGEVMPQSLVEKSETVQQMGGISKLAQMMNDIPELHQRNTDILDETERMLKEEEESDSQLKQQFKDKWMRTPSSQLTKNFTDHIAGYRKLIQTAIVADKMLKEKFETNERGISLLSQGVAAMKEKLPSGTGRQGSSDHPSHSRLLELMEQVDTLKAERDTIESDLKSVTTDMKEKFLMALSTSSSINEPVMSTEALGRTYGPLQQQVKDSINRQQTILAKIQEENNEFIKESEGVGGLQKERETWLKELACASVAFEELIKHLTEGTEFYNNLTPLLVTFQNKISDFCFARKMEKEELMKSLTEDLSRPGAVSAPSIPSHHSSSEVKKADPPPRPPPPTTAPSPQAPPAPQFSPGSSATLPLPYPSQPQMPVPYAPYSTLPYPTQYHPQPMPLGYNPYATIAGYPHGHVTYQMPGAAPVYPPQQYPPNTSGQQQPPHTWQ